MVPVEFRQMVLQKLKSHMQQNFKMVRLLSSGVIWKSIFIVNDGRVGFENAHLRFYIAQCIIGKLREFW